MNKNKETKWVRHCLLIKHIHQLEEYQNKFIQSMELNEQQISNIREMNNNKNNSNLLFQLGELIISRVHVVGIVVQMKEFPEKLQFEIDDGTGLLLCLFWFNKLEMEQLFYFKSLIRIGNLLTLQGKIIKKKEKKVLNVYLLRSFF